MKRSEWILFGVLGAVIIVSAHFLVAGQLAGKARRIADELHQAELSRIEADALLEEKEEWLGREAWVNAHLPLFASEEAAAQELLATAQSAESFSLKVESKELLEVSEHPPLIETGIRLRLNGSLAAVCQWLHNVQQPVHFREIRRFSLTTDPDEASDAIACELTLVRLYRLPPNGI